MLENWLSIRPTLLDVMLAFTVLLGKIFAVALCRRYILSGRNARSAAENLWHVRQLTVALLDALDGNQTPQDSAVDAAPIDVILHLLRIQSGAGYDALLCMASKHGKFVAIQKSLFLSDTKKSLRALQRIEICKSPDCMQTVVRLMQTAKRAEIRLQAAWTFQRMAGRLSSRQILELTAKCKAARPQMHDAIAAIFAKTFDGQPDALFRAFSAYGEGDTGVDMLTHMDTDEATWQLLLLSGSQDADIGHAARMGLLRTRSSASAASILGAAGVQQLAA